MEIMRCRIKRSLWWLALVCVPAGAFFFYAPFQIAQEPPQPSPWPMFFLFGPMALFFWGGALYFALSLVREEIVADEAGLRWRGAFGGWKSACWDEISDFYLSGKPTRISPVISPVQTSAAMTRPTVETPHGKLKLERSFTNLGEMLPFIAARAVNAPSRDWEIFELRDAQNFRQRFIYWTKSQIWTAPILSLGAVYVLGFLTWTIAFPPSSAASQQYRLTWSPDLLSILMIGVKLGPVALIMILSPWMAWRERNRAARYRDEWVEISPRGLAWQNREKRIEASWDEVRAIQVVPGRGFKHDYRVETQNGDFTIHKELEGIALWLQLARQFAQQIAPETTVIDPELGDEAATWSGGEVGKGTRIFHFRTRTTRSVLWLASAFVLVVPLLPLLMHAMKTPDDAPAPLPWKFWAVLFFAVLALSYAWFCFRRAAIWADETGLEWHMPFLKTRRVSWKEIEGFGRDGWEFFIRTAGKKRKLWRVSAPVRQNELLQLIAERATDATGKWDSI